MMRKSTVKLQTKPDKTNIEVHQIPNTVRRLTLLDMLIFIIFMMISLTYESTKNNHSCGNPCHNQPKNNVN